MTTNNEQIIAIEDEYSVPGYTKWPVAFVRGEGCKVWDADGAEYLDLYSGHCVTLVGHSHPKWVKAISAQAAKFGFYSNVAYNDVRSEFQRRLAEFAPKHITRSFLCNSGAEANETSVKIAMKATGRSEIISMEDGFHGRTAGALSLTHLGNYRKQFPAVVRDTKAAKFGDIDDLKRLLTSDTAAAILEPIQSMGGMKCAAPSYYQTLVDVCHKNGTLVIFDEVQTGMGRLGKPFAVDFFGAEVDIITLAKGIGGGFPMGAVLATDKVSKTVSPGDQGTTFGGGPMAAAAGLAVLDIIDEQKLVSHAARMENVAREILIKGPVIGILGHGLLLGLEMKVPAKTVCQYLFDNKILIGTSSNPNVARLMPALVVNIEHLEMLSEALANFRDPLRI